jgi:hypothetical protein
MSSNIAKKQFNLSSLAAVQQGLAADGLNTLAMTQTPLPPLKPKPLGPPCYIHALPNI